MISRALRGDIGKRGFSSTTRSRVGRQIRLKVKGNDIEEKYANARRLDGIIQNMKDTCGKYPGFVGTINKEVRSEWDYEAKLSFGGPASFNLYMDRHGAWHDEHIRKMLQYAESGVHTETFVRKD